MYTLDALREWASAQVYPDYQNNLYGSGAVPDPLFTDFSSNRISRTVVSIQQLSQHVDTEFATAKADMFVLKQKFDQQELTLQSLAASSSQMAIDIGNICGDSATALLNLNTSFKQLSDNLKLKMVGDMNTNSSKFNVENLSYNEPHSNHDIANFRPCKTTSTSYARKRRPV